ncbi:unnamed protein product [Sphenostylis stenocarpa]|uniref:Uncharacterized protein n=1 Tax=Sphenostylis stenocarpa TaxID=92480 RepID=A0AA86VFK1_9FABA|nr:unnamed protein product [Sphenostylis stenocarpa]
MHVMHLENLCGKRDEEGIKYLGEFEHGHPAKRILALANTLRLAPDARHVSMSEMNGGRMICMFNE